MNSGVCSRALLTTRVPSCWQRWPRVLQCWDRAYGPSMLACSDGDESIFSPIRIITTTSMHFLRYPVPGQMSVASYQLQVFVGILCSPGSRQALAAARILTLSFADVSHQVRRGCFLFSGLESPVVFPATGAPQSQVLPSAVWGLSAPPRRCYVATRLHGSARTAAFRDADSAAICKSESHTELELLRSASAI